MPALIILEIHEGMLFKPFEKFMAPIYELLIDNKFEEISVAPAIAAFKTNRIGMSVMVFYTDEKIVNLQKLKNLANKIKTARGRARYIKKISISYQLMNI